MNQRRPDPSPASNLFLLLLVVLLVAALAVVLTFLTLGTFAYVLVIVLTITLVGFVHYATWGQSMTHETSEEHESFARDQASEKDRREEYY